MKEIKALLKEGRSIATYELLHKLRNEGHKFLIDFWVFVPNPDKISEKNNYVARFFADSNRALLLCGGDPQGSGATLGVFVVRKKIRRSKV